MCSGRAHSTTSAQELKARVAEGQRLFENLLGAKPEGGSSEQLEDLSYQWMVYKSKLEDAGHLQVGAQGSGPDWQGAEPHRFWEFIDRQALSVVH